MCYINTGVLFTQNISAYLFIQYKLKLTLKCKERKLFCLHYKPSE